MGMGYELVSGGTENHLVLVNLKNKVKMSPLFALFAFFVVISLQSHASAFGFAKNLMMNVLWFTCDI